MLVGDVAVVNRSVKILFYKNKLQLTKAFAEANLTSSARCFATTNKTHYFFDCPTTWYIVVFELPRLFNLSFSIVSRGLELYCGDYLRRNNLSPDRRYLQYHDNLQRPIKHL